MWSEIKVNILVLALIGAALIGVLAFALEDSADMVFGAASVLLGAFAAVMRDLLAPPPSPVVPADVVMAMLKAMGKEPNG